MEQMLRFPLFILNSMPNVLSSSLVKPWNKLKGDVHFLIIVVKRIAFVPFQNYSCIHFLEFSLSDFSCTTNHFLSCSKYNVNLYVGYGDQHQILLVVISVYYVWLLFRWSYLGIYFNKIFIGML